MLKAAVDRAATDESAGRAHEAYVGFVGIVADFKGLREIAEYGKKAASLKVSKAVKRSLDKDHQQEAEQRRRLQELFGLRARLTAQISGERGSAQPSGPESRQTTISDFKGKLADLKRKSEAKEASFERALARRVLNQFLIASFEESTNFILRRKYDLAISNLATDAELMPDNWRVLYNMACAYALKGDKRHAIETLARAVEKGFANPTELESNHQLDSIRAEAGFKKIVEGLKQKQ